MRRSTFWSLVLVALAAVGCESEVDPTLGTQQPFSLYGYLDPTADWQALRVVPVTPSLRADSVLGLAASVTSTDLATGVTTTWRDSLVTFEDGSTGFVAVADYTPPPGGRVEVRVEGEDGGAVSTTVDIPRLATARFGERSATDGLIDYSVVVEDVPRVITGVLHIRVTGVPAAPEDTTTFVVSLDDLDIRHEGSTWTVHIPFLRETRAFLAETGLSDRLRLIEVEFAPFVANAAWDTAELSDDALVEPGTFSNVAGGFGFVGAGYWSPVRWVPSAATQAASGFLVDFDPAAQAQINEVGTGFVELYNPTDEPIFVGGYIVTDGAPENDVLISGRGLIPSNGFLVVDVPFSATAQRDVVTLFNSRREFIDRLIVEVDVGAQGAGNRSFGRYPDGYSTQVRVKALRLVFGLDVDIGFGQDSNDDFPFLNIDLFTTATLVSPGEPNTPAFVPAVINEVYTEGTDGWVEVLQTSPRLVTARVFSVDVDVARSIEGTPTSDAFSVVDEGGVLALPQIGGDVFLVVGYTAEVGTEGPPSLHVADHRRLGAQGPGRSSGYVPDGPSGVWRAGLIPTRGAPNSEDVRYVQR